MALWALLSPGVLVRTGHTVLTWGITLVLFLHDTELRQWEEQGELFLPLTFLLLVLGSLLLYLAVSLMDPGYVATQPQEELKEEQTAMVPQAIPLRRCRYCLVLQPLRARHCRDCRRCVRRYDHHCPWMENCVRPPILQALGTVATVYRAPVYHLPAACFLLIGGQPAAGLTPLPGGQQYYYLGVHILSPNRLPPSAHQQPL
ncbi:palmitoyltransferase ZDHHC12 isoform X2 [Arvicola amphibius]|uniref:palmitoyltransferase ZDHHC12 isoform X2 n=1 Tax=Arvicola amphibius TaxID=1047088 RepID=UPI0018E2A264|nr:palmitoyltransferase ZDHHC12 isoform X2 [Arvicola amphibius]